MSKPEDASSTTPNPVLELVNEVARNATAAVAERRQRVTMIEQPVEEAPTMQDHGGEA